MIRTNTIFTVALRLMITAISIVSVHSAMAGVFISSEGFEGYPESEWTLVSYPNIPQGSTHQGAYYENYGGFSKSGVGRNNSLGSAYLSVGYDKTWWSAIGKKIKLPPKKATCNLSFYVSPGWKTRNKIRVEVIDPATWYYVSYKDFTVDYLNGGYQYVSTGVWASTQQDVYIRIALGGGSFMPKLEYTPLLGIDDMTLSCVY